MEGVLRHPLRVTGRLIWLAAECAYAAITFFFCVLLRLGPSRIESRALWLQAGCRRVLRIFNANISCVGSIPNRGLLVSNHLSYLDILVIGALTPAVFVAKRDVKNWPVFGWFARLAGTLFADRERRTQVGALTQSLKAVLDQGALVVLFPEGTSSDGQTVLPFKSALLEPAASSSYPLFASLLKYRLDDGDVGEEVCYWKDMTFLPHLLNLLSKRGLTASIRFSPVRQGFSDRKELARQLRSEVVKMKELVLSLV